MRNKLPIIVIAQFFCTAVWFSGNAIIGELSKSLQAGPDFLAHLTSAIQIGFIAGTFVFALLAIADRFSPAKVFFFSALLAAGFNLILSLAGLHQQELLLARFLTGFFLAGIYPVGMKIAADYYEQGLGKSLGYLVGALVLGTALPHLMKSSLQNFSWQSVVYISSSICLLGGLLMLVLVPDGPFRKAGQRIQFNGFVQSFKMPAFRTAALGYFGHMWELYTFWAFVPVILHTYQSLHPNTSFNTSLLSFFIIAAGTPACIAAGYLSQSFGARRIATYALTLSAACCLISPLVLGTSSTVVFIIFLVVWSMVVIADSPLFSSLVATSAPAHHKGASLTIVNSIGFFITIISIEFTNAMGSKLPFPYLYMLLAIGPVLGLTSLYRKDKK